METKKNPKADLRRSSMLYFLVGLTAALSVSYAVIEWKAFEKEVAHSPDLISTTDIIEILPPVVPEPERSKAKIKTPPEIEIIDDTENMAETVIESDEPNQNTEILDISDIMVAEEPQVEEIIDFVRVEEVPVFPGCENANNKRACFQEMILKHIKKNFRYPDAAVAMNQQGKVYIQFTVQKDGTIGDLKLRGPHKILEDEASRIISKLPKMIPGKQRGTPVKVPFALPINFVLQ